MASISYILVTFQAIQQTKSASNKQLLNFAVTVGRRNGEETAGSKIGDLDIFVKRPIREQIVMKISPQLQSVFRLSF